MKVGSTAFTTRMVSQGCPKCFHELDANTCLTEEAKPEPGDYTVCIGCASVLRFRENMSLELSSLEAIPTHSRLPFAQIVQAVKELHSDGSSFSKTK
jgi:hypothetical protein